MSAWRSVFMTCCAFYVLGFLISKLVPSIHMLPGCSWLRSWSRSSTVPRIVEVGANEWYEFLSYVGTPVISGLHQLHADGYGADHVGHLQPRATCSSPSCAVIFAGIGAGVIGYCFKMNFVEAAMTAGCAWPTPAAPVMSPCSRRRSHEPDALCPDVFPPWRLSGAGGHVGHHQFPV
jgi:hypothetical protein